jgi:hypothetical protein
MSISVASVLKRTRQSSLASFRHVRTLFLLIFFFVPLCSSQVGQAKESCPWLNEATAAGFLDGGVTGTVTHSDKNKDDGNCDFTRHDKSFTTVLLIEVKTMTGPPASFASYAAQCGSYAAQLKAVGNEAVACGFDGKKRQVSEQVVGRVRDRAFLVRITTNSDLSDRPTLREKAKRVAEQVAGFLF